MRTPAEDADGEDMTHKPRRRTSRRAFLAGGVCALAAAAPFAATAARATMERPVIASLILLLGTGACLLLAAAREHLRGRRHPSREAYVDAMQRALVPDIPEAIGGLSISTAYSPAQAPEAGGAFYDAFELEDGQVGIVLGNTSGHGRRALARATLERATLARYGARAFLETGLEPRAVLKLAGSVLGEDQQDGLVTVAVAVFDPSAETLTYALAGHPPPLLLGAGLDAPLTVFSSPPLGSGLPTGLRQTTVSLAADTTVCFFSDSLAKERAGGATLGRANVERLLMRLGPGPGSADLLLRSLREEADSIDGDMAACVLRRGNASRQAPVHLEELELGPAPQDPTPFLVACGVAPDVVSSAVEAGTAIDSGSSVLLRVHLDDRHPSVDLHEIDAEARERGGFFERGRLIGIVGLTQ